MAFPIANRPFDLLTSAVRTDHADTGAPLRKSNRHYRGLRLTVDLTDIDGTSITFTIQGYDPLSGKTYTLLASAAQTGAATVSMLIYPGCVAVANLTANTVLPEQWQVTASGTITDATYSIRAELLP